MLTQLRRSLNPDSDFCRSLNSEDTRIHLPNEARGPPPDLSAEPVRGTSLWEPSASPSEGGLSTFTQTFYRHRSRGAHDDRDRQVDGGAGDQEADAGPPQGPLRRLWLLLCYIVAYYIPDYNHI